VGASSVERVISRFAPLPSDGGDDDDREREVKTRMGAVGEKVLRVTAAGGVRF